MPPAEALSAHGPSYEQAPVNEGPIQYLERLCGLRRFEPKNKIGFKKGVVNLATKTRSFFGRLGLGKKK